MYIKSISLSILLLLTALFVHAQHRYPSYPTVVKRFFKAYNLDLSDRERYSVLKFQKRPSGWHVVINEYQDGVWQEASNELFWNSESRSYQSLKYDKKPVNLSSLMDHEFYQRCGRVTHCTWRK